MDAKDPQILAAMYGEEVDDQNPEVAATIFIFTSNNDDNSWRQVYIFY